MDDQIEFIIADLELFTQGELVALALNVDANLRSNPPIGTPVDIGWARANWVPSVGEPILLPDIKNPDPTHVAARNQQRDAALNQVLGYRLTDGPLFNSNNVVYIARLNDGHSPQSPPGFVQAALVKAVNETEVRARTKMDRASRAGAARASKKRPRP